MSDSHQPQLASAYSAGQLPGERKSASSTIVVFLGLLVAGLAYSFYRLRADVTRAGPVDARWLPYLLLGVVLLIALGVEFANGLHDAANAGATVTYTGQPGMGLIMLILVGRRRTARACNCPRCATWRWPGC